MKKGLAVLLALVVVFTFSFGGAVAFAADNTYSYDEWNTALQAEKEVQLSYLATTKTQALNSYSFNNEGFVDDTNFTEQAEDIVAGYSKEALAEAADTVISDLEDEMDAAIRNQLNQELYPTDNKPNMSIVSDVTKDYLTKTAMQAALQSKVEDIEKAQAPLTKRCVIDKIAAIDLFEYNSIDKDYQYTAPIGSAVIGTVVKGDKITAADAVQTLIDTLNNALKEADKKTTKVEQRHAYERAYAEFRTELDKIEQMPEPLKAQISAEEAACKVGNTVRIPISLTNNPGMASLKLELSYDTDVFEFISAESGKVFPSSSFRAPSTDETDAKVLLWNNSTIKENITSNGRLAFVTFRIKDDAQTGKYTVSLLCNAENKDAININGQAVPIQASDISIIANDFEYGDLDDNGRVDASDVLQLERYLAKWSAYSSINVDTADVDGDGVVSLRDVTILERHIAGWEWYETLPMKAEVLPVQ